MAYFKKKQEDMRLMITTKNDNQNENQKHRIPHFLIETPWRSSTPCRIVINASAKTKPGSLHECMYRWPTDIELN